MRVVNVIIGYDSFIISEANVKSNYNSNKIVNDSLYYTKKYINRNKDKVVKSLNIGSINKVKYEDFGSFLAIGDLLKFKTVIFNIKKSVPTSVLDKLLLNDNLEKIECYFMPSDYVHKFAEKNVSIKFNNDMSFNLEFVRDNKFKDLKSIYYKKKISFYSSDEVFKNLEEFLKVNSSLKLIDLYYYSDEVIEYITDMLKKYKFKDVNIFIHQDESNVLSLGKSNSYLKKLNKRYSGKDKKLINIVYSDKFFRNNIFKELTFNGLKFSMVIILYIGFVFVISERYHEYISMLNLRLIENTLASEEVEIDEMDDSEVEAPEVPEPVQTPEPEKKEEYVNYYANIPTTFDKLTKINKDVVGWVKVNNTKVNYPVTQSYDNKYYLTHDIYKNYIITGWVFMDYRNNSKELDRNTIIYGHNLISNYMFGDLKKTVYYSWYTNKDNQIITFNTLNRNMKFQIFSIYTTNYTNDYMTTQFFDDAEFMKFLNMVKKRSMYNFNVNLHDYDKILTLSTCTGSNNRRLVIHAVMVDG